jgi:hypothetical protein
MPEPRGKMGFVETKPIGRGFGLARSVYLKVKKFKKAENYD